MTFIVSAASTAAVAAVSGGAITTGVAGAISAGALGSAAAGIGAGAVAGGAVGAGLGAGVAAIQGKDAGQGALMGAATGAIGGAVLPGVGGAMSGAGQGAGQVAGQTAATGATQTAATGATQTAATGATQTATTGIGQEAANAGINAAGTNVGSGVVAPTADTVFTGGNITSDFAPAAVSNPGLGTNVVGTNVGTGVVAPTADTAYTGLNMAPQTPLQQGIAVGKENTTAAMNWLGNHKAETMIGGAALLPMLGGSEPNNGTEYTPDNTNYLSSNFQRTAPQGVVPVSGYASGGILSGMPGAGLAKDFVGQISPSLSNNLFGKGPMNPIVAKGMQQAQQAQQAQGPQQAMQAQGPQQAMQGPAPAPVQQAANGGIMHATDSNLGSYAHGGIPRLLSGEGDGISDDIPATIAGKQPARLANNEFVIPARVVSELGNGSSEAGGKILQAMVDRIQARRAKTIGKGKVAVNSKAVKDLPA